MRPSRDVVFQAIYDAHAPDVMAYFARRVAREHVDDLTAETFAVAWRKLPLDVREPLPWLYAVAHREVLAHRRRQQGRGRLIERIAALTPRHVHTVDPPALEPHLSPALTAAFARLSANEREAILLVAWEGLDHRHAAQVAGCTTATFTVRVSRARRKLQTALAPPAPSTAEPTP